jgi:hypothetical protein
MRRVAAGLMLLSAVLSLTACGGGSAKDKDKGKEQDKDSGADAALCRMPAMTEKDKLPAGFPTPANVTYVTQKQDGPTLEVDGWYKGNFTKAFNSYRHAIQSSTYQLLDKDHDPDDAEFNYSGDGKTGQIALGNHCGGSKVSIAITNRP